MSSVIKCPDYGDNDPPKWCHVSRSMCIYTDTNSQTALYLKHHFSWKCLTKVIYWWISINWLFFLFIINPLWDTRSMSVRKVKPINPQLLTRPNNSLKRLICQHSPFRSMAWWSTSEPIKAEKHKCLSNININWFVL